jgi:hypothetical protein
VSVDGCAEVEGSKETTQENADKEMIRDVNADKKNLENENARGEPVEQMNVGELQASSGAEREDSAVDSQGN